MQCIGVDSTGEYLARSGLYSIVCTCQACDGVEQYHYVVSAFDKSLGFLVNHIGYLNVFAGRFVECRRYNLRIYAAFHIGNLLGTFVDEKYYHIHLRMVFGYCICYLF